MQEESGGFGTVEVGVPLSCRRFDTTDWETERNLETNNASCVIPINHNFLFWWWEEGLPAFKELRWSHGDSDEMGAEVPETAQDVAVVAVLLTEASAVTTSTALPATVLPVLPSYPHAAATSAAACANAAPSVTRFRPANAPRQQTKRVALVNEMLSAERDARVEAVREESALQMKLMVERQAWQKKHEEQQHALHMNFLKEKYAIELQILKEQRDGGRCFNCKET